MQIMTASHYNPNYKTSPKTEQKNKKMAKPNLGKSGKNAPVVSDYFNTVEFPLNAHQSPHGRVTAVSMMKDEGPFVLEWIAHHLAVGFTDILVYTNDCSDGTDEMLIRLEELGLAHHRRNDIKPGIRPQPSAIKYAQNEPVVCASDWVLMFDADEFLCIRHGDGSIDGMINSAVEVGANGVVITWRTFGSGGVHDWSRAPVTEQYLYAAPTMWNKGWGVKTLFKFDPEYWKLGIHRPKIKNKHLETGFPDTVKWLNGSGQPMEEYFKYRGWRSIVRTVGYDWVQMNHYAVKSIDSYAIRKFRGNVNFKKDKYNSDYWALQDRNEAFDDGVLRYSQRRRQIYDLLLTDPVLNKLHFNAVENAEARLDAFKDTPAYKKLVVGLRAASKISISEVVAKPPKKRDPEKIATLMSNVEKKASQREKLERRKRIPINWDRKGDIYIDGHGLSHDSKPQEFHENKELAVPADPQIFTPSALHAITEGKFERNGARRIPQLLTNGDTYLELGAGIGFLPAVIAKECPSVRAVAQEDRDDLAGAAVRFWQHNQLDLGASLALVTSPVGATKAPPSQAPGLPGLLSETRCNVLHVNHPEISARLLGDALRTSSEHLPRAIILGARSLANQMNEKDVTAVLAEQNFAPVQDNPLANALLFVANP